jgi:hypothetical protein
MTSVLETEYLRGQRRFLPMKAEFAFLGHAAATLNRKDLFGLAQSPRYRSRIEFNFHLMR